MTNELVHAHEVMKIVDSAEDKFSVEELKSFLEEKFGENVQFTNCSGQPFSFSEIMEFMEMRGKIEVDSDNKVSFLMSCSH